MAGLLYDHLCAQVAETGIGRLGKHFLSFLGNAPVYDITNVYGLFPDWEKESSAEIPRRPPHDHLWVEWLKTDANGEHRVGVWIESANTPEGQPVRDSVAGMIKEREVVADDIWLCTPYVKLIRSEIASHQDVVGRLIASKTICGVFGTTELKSVSGFMAHWDYIPPFKVPLSSLHQTGSMWPFIWPAFMAFGLLHCRNVSTELVQQHDPHAERRRNRGLPPKASYHVLRLELPNEIRPHAPTADEAESERKMRFHLCRGHFKNLQHERYKSKGWHWWPAHWKGSKDIGVIDKRYELRQRPEPAATGA